MYYSIISSLQTAINMLILRETRADALARSSSNVLQPTSGSTSDTSTAASTSDPLFGASSSELTAIVQRIMDESLKSTAQRQSSSHRRSSMQSQQQR